MHVQILLGNIFNGGVDLTVLPCSAKPSVSKWTRNWINSFNLEDPIKFDYPLTHGGVSKVYEFKDPSKLTKYYVYGAAVLNDYSSYDLVFSLARELGIITKKMNDVRVVETVLHGAGAGRLENKVSARALALGFAETAREDARLIIYAPNSDAEKELQKAIDTKSIEKLAEKISFRPSFAGMGFDLTEEKNRLLKWLFRLIGKK